MASADVHEICKLTSKPLSHNFVLKMYCSKKGSTQLRCMSYLRLRKNGFYSHFPRIASHSLL